MSTQNKRERLIDSAAILFHRNGLHATSLADIAKDADIPIGNVYYYFKTKEELALAAIEKRREQFGAAFQMLDEAIEDPRQRLIEAVSFYDKARDEYARLGCPIGKTINDADVTKDNVALAASLVFNDFVEWAQRQFELLGHYDTARSYAVSILCGLEGAIIIAKSYNDPMVIASETARLTQWLESIPNRKIQLGKVALKAAAETSNAA